MRKTFSIVFCLLVILFFCQTATAQKLLKKEGASVASNRPIPKYLDARFSTEERVADLVSRLNLAQKIKLLMYRGTAIDSAGLKIPAYNWGMKVCTELQELVRQQCFHKPLDWRTHGIPPYLANG